MPADKIPYWDFNAPGVLNEPRDASAAAIMASALLELAGMVDGDVQSRYQTFAEEQLHSLSSPAYHAPLSENGNFLLMHCIGDMPHTKEVNTLLIYADYYYLEALARYERQSAKSR
jgi:unsaturated chondroitin disaccharide hydrolase